MTRAALLLLLASTPALAAPSVRTTTREVEDLATDGRTLWAATRGGLEAYDLSTLARTQLYTTADGLPESRARRVRFVDGAVEVDTDRARCRLMGARLVCARRAPDPPTPAGAAPIAYGARVTAALTVDGRRFVGTAGEGLWLEGPEPRRLTPAAAVCDNHVAAIAPHRGALYLGGFDGGLCRLEGDRARPLAAPFRMVNRLLSTPRGLVIAASEGLFVTEDGERFERVLRRVEGWNGLALAGATLWATTPLAVYRFSVGAAGLRLRAVRERPGGSTALQGVAVAAGAVWLASEDRGVVRLRGRETTLLDRAAGLPASWIVDLAAVDGAIYAATLRDGLVRLSPTAEGARVERVAGVYPWLLRLAADAGTLWIAAQGGAMSLAPGDGAARSIAAALPHENVHAVARVGDALWLGTEGGLLVVPAYFQRGGSPPSPL